MVKERCLQRVLQNKIVHRAEALFHLAVFVNLPRLQHGELGLQRPRTGLVVGTVEVCFIQTNRSRLLREAKRSQARALVPV